MKIRRLYIFAAIIITVACMMAAVIASIGSVSANRGFSSMFSGKNIKSLENDIETPDYLTEDSGVLITASSGAIVTLNNAIDLSKLTKQDKLISFYVLGKANEAEYRTITFTFTDKYDENRVLTVEYSQAPGDKWCYAQSYIRAGVGSNLGGLNGAYFNNVPYGTVVQNSFFGKKGSEASLEYTKRIPEAFGFSIDYENNSIYTFTAAEKYGEPKLVVDFNDYDTCGIEWNNFITGEVYMNILFPSGGAKMQMLVSEIAGQKLSKDSVDDKGPEIYISTDKEYGETLPDALLSEEYSIPTAYSNDLVSGICDVGVIIKDVGGAVLEYEGNKATFNKTGKYTIEYSAKDANNNLTVRELHLEVKDSIEPITAVIDVENFTAGIPFKLPDIGLNGGSGVLKKRVDVIFNDVKIVSDENDFYLIKSVGTVTLEINVTDYLGTTKILHNIDVIADEKPVVEIRNVPTVGFVGYELVFDNYFEAVDYYGGSACSKSVYVNGVRLAENLTYIPQTEGEITVEYVAISCGRETIKSYNVNIAKKDNIIGSFIHAKNVFAEMAGSDGFRFYSSSDFSVSIPCAVVAEGFDLSFKLSTDSKLCILKIEDRETRSKIIEIELTPKNQKESYVRINGRGKYYTIEGSFVLIANSYNIGIKNGVLLSGGKAIVSFSEYKDGRKYDGFGSGAAIATIELKGVESESSVYFYRIANQPLISIDGFYSDAGPLISYSGTTHSQLLKQNSVLTVYSATASDVFTGDAGVMVKLKSPSGKVLLEGEACLDKTFTLTEFGEYVLQYYSQDLFGNYAEDVFYISVTDFTPPEIIVVNKPAATVKVGEEITISEAYAIDVFNGETIQLTYMIYGYDESNAYKTLHANDKVKMTKTGEYHIVYIAFDSQNNMARKEFVVRVTL